MAKNYVKYINGNLRKLADYINHIIDLNNKYGKAVKDLCIQSKKSKVTKSKELIEYEKDLKQSYDKAMKLYNDLTQIAERYKAGRNIDSDIQWFHSNFNLAGLTTYKKITLQLKKINQKSKNSSSNNEIVPVLKSGISKSNIDIEKEEFERNVKIWEDRIQKNMEHPILGRFGGTIYNIKNKIKSPDAVGMINIASGKYLPLYTKDTIKINNIFDKKLDKFDEGYLSGWQSYMADKISYQFEDFNYVLDDINGYIFKNSSAVVKRIKNSEEFKNIILKHKNEIEKGKSFSDRFKDDYNLHNAFGSVDFFNAGLDKNGNFHLYMFDTYDFNKGENAKVEAGRRQMLKGNLKGFFSIHKIIIKKEDLEKYGL